MQAPRTKLELTFGGYQRALSRVLAYVNVVSTPVRENPGAVPVFVEALSIATVARLEHFLVSLFAGAVHEREDAVRRNFAKHGSDGERRVARTCSRGVLIRMVKRRISFAKRASGIEAMSDLLFGFPPWPDQELFETLSDLVLLRNIFVHEGDRVLPDYARQAFRKELFTANTYGEFVVHPVNYSEALRLVRDATAALQRHMEYIRAELLKRREWVWKPGDLPG